MDVRRDTVQSFAPVWDRRAKVMVLGSMPGRKSLDEQMYYAHPRNAFWSIMGDLLEFDAACDYPQRLQMLQAKGVALWDVFATCRRVGSLDSAIELTAAAHNDMASLVQQLPQLCAFFCNGATAAKQMRIVQKTLPGHYADLPCYLLPSTSPAHARMSWEEKRRAWGKLKNYCL